MNVTTRKAVMRAAAEMAVPPKSREVPPAPVISDGSDIKDPPFESDSIVPPKPLFPVPASDADDVFDSGNSKQDPAPIAETRPVRDQGESKPVVQPKGCDLPVPAVRTRDPDKLDSYLSRKRRITLRLSNGIVMMTVLDIAVSATNVLIIIPTDTDGCVFFPTAGETMTVESGNQAYQCAAPGFVNPIDGLGITLITLVRQEVIGASDK